MKNPKSKIPKPKETPNPKSQRRSRRVGPLLLSLLPVFLLPFSSAASDSVLSTILRSPRERAADLDGLAADWIQHLAGSAEGPWTELLLLRLKGLAREMPHPGGLEGPLKEWVETSKLKGVHRQIARDILADRYRTGGRQKELESLDPDRGFILHWAIIGPLGIGARSQLERPFPPELEVDLGRSHRGLRRELRWRLAARKKPVRTMESRPFLGSREGVVYHLAQLHSMDPRQGILRLESSEPVWLFLNGRALARESGGRFLSSPRRFEVRLEKGWNRLLLKNLGSSFSVQLTGPDGEPLGEEAIRQETSLELHPLPLRVAGPSRDPDPSRGADRSRDPDRSPEDAGLEHMGLALRSVFYGRPDLAVEHAERALEALPEDPFIQYHAGRVFLEASHLPREHVRRKARGAFESALHLDSGFVPARLKLAAFLVEDHQPRLAAEEAQVALSENPRCPPAHLLLHRIYESQGWEAEALKTAQTLVELFPSSPAPYLYRARLAERRHNVAAALVQYRAALERNRERTDLLEDIARLQRRRGNLVAAIETAREWHRREPDSPEAALHLSRILIDSGDLDGGTAVLQDHLRFQPQNREVRRRLAEALETSGRDQAAAAAYREILAAAPGEISLKRYVDRNLDRKEGGAPESFWAPYDEDLKEWIPRIPERSKYPRADSVAVLDIAVVRIYPEGSTSEYTHQAFLLLSEQSKENLARVQTEGEILLLRTLSPEGRSLEPVAAMGKGTFMMPGLQPGAFVEYAHVADRPNFKGWLFQSGPFYFQDFTFRQPFLLSRYVLLIPEGFGVKLVERALRGPSGQPLPAGVTRAERPLPGGGKAVIYEARDVPRLDREIRMPPREDYLPNVSVVEKRSWFDVADHLEDRVRGRARLTPDLVRFAKESAEGLRDATEKARALYRKVQERTPTLEGPREAAGVFRERAGDRDALYKALLDAVGIPAHWAFLRPRKELVPAADWSHPRPDLFGKTVIYVEPRGGEPAWVTLAARQAPLGVLPHSYQGGLALVLKPGGPAVLPVPRRSLEESAEALRATVTLGQRRDAPRSARVKLEVVSRSYNGFARKEQIEALDLYRRNLILRGFGNALFPGARVQEAEFPDVEKPGLPFKVRMELEAPKYLLSRNGDILLRPVIQPLQMVRSFIRSPSRKHPYRYTGQVAKRDRIRVNLPDRYGVLRLPRGSFLISPIGTYSLRFRSDEGVIFVERDVTLEPAEIPPEDFPRLLEFCKAIDQAESERILLGEK